MNWSSLAWSGLFFYLAADAVMDRKVVLGSGASITASESPVTFWAFVLFLVAGGVCIIAKGFNCE